MMRNLENKGNPWGENPAARLKWAEPLDFEVPIAEPGGDFEYLYWVGCAGAYDPKAQKTSRAVATLLHEAGVKFAVLGEAETCTGDPARRIGHEFMFQMLAEQNVEALNEVGATKIIATCPHCLNTIGNEYSELEGKYEVVHHTELLADLVASGRITPVEEHEGKLTYHDPCYLGRHNRVFTPPRELLGSFAEVTEMPRNSERSFCCGAGGARMWLEEPLGKRVNRERADEAVATGAETVAVGCPFCSTMLRDGVADAGKEDSVEVIDIAQLLARTREEGRGGHRIIVGRAAGQGRAGRGRWPRFSGPGHGAGSVVRVSEWVRAGGRLPPARGRAPAGGLAGAARGAPRARSWVVAPGTLLRPRHQSCEARLLTPRERGAVFP
ncbi:hypothetical protein GCM10029992_16700 [Glycomyces albus]